MVGCYRVNKKILSSLLLFYCAISTSIVYSQTCDPTYNNVTLSFVELMPENGVTCYYVKDQKPFTNHFDGNYVPASGHWWFGSLGFPAPDSYNCGIDTKGNVTGDATLCVFNLLQDKKR